MINYFLRLLRFCGKDEMGDSEGHVEALRMIDISGTCKETNH